MPYKSYSRAKLCDDHEKTSYHREAHTSALAFLSIMTGQSDSIKQQVGQSKAKLKSKKQRLHAVVKSLIVCAKQGIALRAHRNEEASELVSQPLTTIDRKKQQIVLGDKNPGNFLHLMKFREDSGDQTIQDIAKCSSYTSPRVQNSLLQLISEQMLGQVVSRMGNGFFTVIADETSDVSNKEQLCLALRYIHVDVLDVPKVEERFIKFVTMPSVTGEQSNKQNFVTMLFRVS